jgi:hypothetical protein
LSARIQISQDPQFYLSRLDDRNDGVGHNGESRTDLNLVWRDARKSCLEEQPAVLKPEHPKRRNDGLDIPLRGYKIDLRNKDLPSVAGAPDDNMTDYLCEHGGAATARKAHPWAIVAPDNGEI